MEQCSVRPSALKIWEVVRAGGGAENLGAALCARLLLGRVRAHRCRFAASAVVLAAMPGDACLRLDVQRRFFQLLPFAWLAFFPPRVHLLRAAKGTHPAPCPSPPSP